MRPVLVTTVVIASSFVAVPPVFVSSGVPVSGELIYPRAYIAVAPVSNVLDALSLLSLRQHVAVLATVLVVYAIWRLTSRLSAPPLAERLIKEILTATGLLASIATVYAVGLLVARPMAALALQERDQLTVDFHSHTNASHDVRPGFTPEANREWHRSAGFAVGYVSDHETLKGALAARPYNASIAGAGTILLAAMESVCLGQHVILLGMRRADSLSRRWGCSEQRARADAADSAMSPLVIFTLPGNLASLPALPNLIGAELVDGAPRALDQSMRYDPELRRSARDMRLALVASSNNHGWGRTAVAWNVMTIPGWRDMNPDSLDAAIQRQLRENASRAVTLVERRRIARNDPSLAGLATTLPSVAWLVLLTLSWPERIVWVASIWICWGVAWAIGGIALSPWPSPDVEPSYEMPAWDA